MLNDRFNSVYGHLSPSARKSLERTRIICTVINSNKLKLFFNLKNIYKYIINKYDRYITFCLRNIY